MEHNAPLSLSVGETVLSWSEAAALAPGDLVLTFRQAGYPSILLYDHLPVALAEVVVIDGRLGARVVDTDFRPAFRVDPGRVDTVGDLMPALVILGSLDADPRAVAGLGRHSLVRFSAPGGTTAEGVLRFAGLDLARGRVVVSGDQMGLRITEVLVRLDPAGAPALSGSLADAAAQARAKDYDFTRADAWSAAQIRQFEAIHRRAARLFPGAPAADLWVDQMNGAEAVQWLAEAGLGPLGTYENPRGRPRKRPLGPTLVLEDPEAPALSAPARAWIETWYGEDSALARSALWVHGAPTLGPAQAPAAAEALRQGWRGLVDLALEPVTGGDPAPAPHEMVLLAAGRDASGRWLWAAVYPFGTLEPYAQVLGA